MSSYVLANFKRHQGWLHTKYFLFVEVWNYTSTTSGKIEVGDSMHNKKGVDSTSDLTVYYRHKTYTKILYYNTNWIALQSMNVSGIQTQKEPLLLVLSRGSSTSVITDQCNNCSSPSNRINLGLGSPPSLSCEYWILPVPIRVSHYTNNSIERTKPVFTLHKGLYYCLEGMCAVSCLRWHEITQFSHRIPVWGLARITLTLSTIEKAIEQGVSEH